MSATPDGKTPAAQEPARAGDPAGGGVPGAGEEAPAEPGTPRSPDQEPPAEPATLEPAADESGAAEGAPPPKPAVVLRGTPVSPGLVLGVVHRKDYDLTRASPERVPSDRVEDELNRFHQALVDARAQLADLKTRLAGKVPADDARILDVHVAYLKDSVFISDVENLILGEQLSLEAAIGKVISDFDRIFKLVRNETLRERAVDLRDVGIRVLRQLELRVPAEEAQEGTDAEEAEGDGGSSAEPRPPRRLEIPEDYVLVAHELSIVDMFNMEGDHVLGVLTEAGGLTSHAAILARSMRIPTLTGVEGLLDTLREGDFVIIDASEGSVRVNPDERVRAQYQEARRALGEPAAPVAGEWSSRVLRTADGEELSISASCGNLPEVEQAATLGLGSVGLYRTELLYLVEKDQPSLETLTRHYASVAAEARGGAVTYRLLHADASLGLAYLHSERELNPALGVAGVRTLLAHEAVLRRQIQAILRGSVGTPARIAVPFVNDTGELRRVKEILFEERLELRKTDQPFHDKVELGVVIETPAALLGARDLAREADFLRLGLDSFVQYLLASDRENHALRASFETLHPAVLRSLSMLVRLAREENTPLSVFGVTATHPDNLPFLIGVGLRDFCLPPAGLEEFAAQVALLDSRTARRAAEAAGASSCQAETLSLIDGYRHGYARPGRS